MTGPELVGVYVVTRTSASCGMTMRTASLITCPPGGTTTAGPPLKVSCRMVSSSAAGVPLPAATAIEACVMFSGDWP